MIRQTGEWERLLCQHCDNQFSPHENYVRNLFHGRTKVRVSNNKSMFTLHDCDYTHVRLCFLSILWRMAVSSRPFFSNVNLGPHEKRLAQMLLTNNPGAPDEYGFFCSIPLLDGEVLDQLVLEPTWTRADGHRIYRTVMGGLIIMHWVSSHALTQTMKAACIQPDGTWHILSRPVHKIPFVHETLIKMAQNNN